MRTIRELRDERHWSQQALADRLGVHVITVSRWERNELGMSATARRLAALTFGVPVDTIAYPDGSDAPPRKPKPAEEPTP